MNGDLDVLFPRPQRLEPGTGWISLGTLAKPCPLVLHPAAQPLERSAAQRIQTAFPGWFGVGEAAERPSFGVFVDLVERRPDRRAAEALPPNPEAYLLTGDDHGIYLLGRGPAGALYAAETFRQLARPEGDHLLFPRVTIADWPDYRYRGLYVESKWGPDRMTLADWRELIDLLAGWKLNSLGVGIYGCWGLQYPGQLTAWVMVPFPKHPKLRTPQEIAYFSPSAGERVRRRYLPTMFEQDLFGEIVAYGRSRNVVVRPHFNGPGHNTVIPREYPEVSARDEAGQPTGYGYCLSSESTYALLFDLYDSIVERYLRPNGVSWWHLGMDEVYPVNGIDPRDELRLVDPWCKCPRCRERPNAQLLLDFAFRSLHHLRAVGIDNVTIWHDCLERMGIVDSFGERLEREGLKPYVILQWWRYHDPVPTPRSDVSRTWVTPMAGYYHWMFHGSYLFNVAPFVQRGYDAGSEGVEAYVTFDYANQRNYLALAEWSWNRQTSGLIYDFEAKYARWLFPGEVVKGTEALYKFYQVLGSAPLKAVLDNFIFYWYSYPGRRIDFPRDIFRQLLVDRIRTLAGLQACVPPLEEAIRLLGELRDAATDRRIVDELVVEARRVLAVVDAYVQGVRAIQEYRQAVASPPDARPRLERAEQASQRALESVDSLLSNLERVKAPYLQPQQLRDLTYLRDFVAALRDEVQRARRLVEAGEPLPPDLVLLEKGTAEPLAGSRTESTVSGE